MWIVVCNIICVVWDFIKNNYEAIIGISIIINFALQWRARRNDFIKEQEIAEIQEIKEKLKNFYGPFKELRRESADLYNIFALKEKKEAKDAGKRFRTVDYLTTNNKFSAADEALLEQIRDITEQEQLLIEKYGWEVENPTLCDLLGRFGSHIRVLLLAINKKLTVISYSEEITYYRFPLEIDGAIESQISKLIDRKNELIYGKKQRNKISRKTKKSINYYNRDYSHYFDQTNYINMNEVNNRVRNHINMGSRVLDVGCGVGRDTRYLIKNGYRVISIDASHKMVELCNKYAFAYAKVMEYKDISYVEEFDCVWACAALVHLEKSDFVIALNKFFNALKTDGILYLSVKETKNTEKSGLKYYSYTKNDVDEMIKKVQYVIEEKDYWNNEGKKEGTEDIFHNFVFIKKKYVEIN